MGLRGPKETVLVRYERLTIARGLFNEDREGSYNIIVLKPCPPSPTFLLVVAFSVH